MIYYTLVAQIYPLRSPTDSVGQLRSFYDSVEGNLRELEARGEDVAGNNALRLIIQEKLPRTVAEWTWKCSKTRNKLGHYLCLGEIYSCTFNTEKVWKT